MVSFAPLTASRSLPAASTRNWRGWLTFLGFVAPNLILLAIFYPASHVAPLAFALLLAPAIALAWLLRRRSVASFWPYVLGAGGLSSHSPIRARA